MLDLLMALPPIHASAATASDAVFWVMLGLFVVVAVAVTILWIVGSRRIAQRQSQAKETEGRHEALPKFEGKAQTPIYSEEDLVVRR